MAKLTTARRKALPASTFAGPGRSYPVPDANHARLAKAMATRFASPAVKAQVDRKANAVLSRGLHASMSSHPNASRLGAYLHPVKGK